MFARVLVDIKAKELNRLFDYIVPEQEKSDIKKGMRVIVPFGEQKRLGFVIDLVDESELATREIIEILDIIPTISNESFKYIEFLNKTNLTLYINVLETILAKELFVDYEQYLIVNDSKALPDKIKTLFNNKNKVLINNKIKEEKRLITKLLNNNTISLKREYKNKAKKKTVRVINYNKINHTYSRYNNYLDLISFVKENNNLTLTEITEHGFSPSSVNTLIKNNVFNTENIVVERTVDFIETNKVPNHQLNSEQSNAYNQIKSTFNKNKIHLLFGITGSGKTEVYMHLIDEMLKQNKKVLYLVPEITLVAPTVRYLKSRFNEEITHYNSNLSKGQRYDAWHKIIEDEAKIVVGTRSSVFLPINDLGIIIVDEEHDSSYNQEDRVQYNLIDILKIKSKHHNIPIVLGSATPKVSSMYYAKNGKYNLLELTKRATNAPLPKISFIDMKEELMNGNIEIFSKKLKQKIKDRLSKNEQTILLYNRKGYASFLLCRNCGHVPKCPNCDISLTYFKDNNELVCSYCKHKEQRMSTCDSCGSNKIGEVGLGVEQVFEKVKKTFKEANVLLMDAKSTSKKGSHEKLWLDFKDHKYDILVGTQMVSKGLDFPNVTLVGILMADLELKVPNYLATELTYNLLTQMVGRSGRNSYGEAIIQGYDLNNFAISSVDKSYYDFYNQAIYYREVSKYEPFYQMVQILITNKSYLKAYQDALNIKKILERNKNIVLGPTEPIIKYIKNEYRFVITIKAKKIDYENIFDTIKIYSDSSNIMFYNISQII